MIVSLKHGFVFLCMTKCASTSTELILRPYGQLMTDGGSPLKHVNFRQYERFVKPLIMGRANTRTGPTRKYQSLEVVCLFREPVDWLYSWYRYRSRPRLSANRRKLQRYTGNMSFEEFAREYVSAEPRTFARVGRQINFIKDRHGRIGEITVFRYEDYAAFLKYLSAKIGTQLEAPVLNQSPEDTAPQDIRLGFLMDYLAEDYEFYRNIPVRT